jgi:hypothetical protein
VPSRLLQRAGQLQAEITFALERKHGTPK